MSSAELSEGIGGMQGYAVFVVLFAAFFLTFEAIFLSFARRSAMRGDLKRRLSRQEKTAEPHAALVKIRRMRGLSARGEYTMPMIWLNRLVVQSGVTWGVAGVPLLITGLSVAAFALLLLLGFHPILALLVAPACGGGLPVLLLLVLRSRRRHKFEAQLPDALDTLVRGLKAGHPVSAAIKLVVRELHGPVGAEFAIVADELTYGLDLETAMNNVSTRVGQQDLALVVVAIGIQAKSGGNLAEILSGLSKVIRDRLRMRLKVKALSAEGRFSALLLSILPFALFGLLYVIAPHFYGDVMQYTLVKPVLLGATLWMLIGDMFMYRMVKFEI
jgi:tight adherence protein B